MQPEIMGTCESNDEKLSDVEIEEKIKRLRNLIDEKISLKMLRRDDLFLLRFLHCCQFNVDASFGKILEFYNFLTEQKDLVAVDPPEKVKMFTAMKLIFAMPQSDKAGRRICLTRLAHINPSEISITQYIRLIDLWIESILDDPLVQARDISMVVDASGVSWKILSWFTPSNVKKIVRRLDNIMVKELLLHVVKSSAVINVVLKIVLPLLPARIKNQIKFHFNDMASLYRYISPESLSINYGGKLAVDYDDLNKELMDRNSELTETLRHYRLICSEDITS